MVPKIDVGDIELYVETEGSGEPVLFLHGLGSSLNSWDLQRELFAERYRVILLDVRGHGRSDRPPGPYSVPQFTADVVKALDALGETAVHVVGLSMGGMIGFQLAVDYPERVRSLTAVNSGPALVAESWRDRLRLWQRQFILSVLSMEKIGAFIGKRLFPEPHQADLLQMFMDEFRKNDQQAYKAATQALIGWSVRDRIGWIQCPVLVVAADQDYTPVDAKAAYTAEIPNAELKVIANSRHATPIDQPAAFNTAVLQFLSQTAV